VKLEFQPIERSQALAILNWHYTHPYDYYNFDPDTIHSDLTYLLDPENAFYSILSCSGELIGFCSCGLDGQVPGGDYSAKALDLGMGIRPDLVGQGLGKHYAQAVMCYLSNKYKVQNLRVTIAAFNQRAQRVWEQLGFQQIARFTKFGSAEEFVMMSGIVMLKD
jgi:[ribosomal protein S18]-alanine N-acetyltransferase